MNISLISHGIYSISHLPECMPGIELYGFQIEHLHCRGMKNIIKFIPESIWVFGEHELVSADKFHEITTKQLSRYVTIQAEDLLEIYNEVALKRTGTYNSV